MAKSYNLDNLRKFTPFKKADIFLYASAVILVVFLFIFFVALPKDNANGFLALVGDKTALTFKYGDNSYVINEEFKDLITVDNDGEIIYFTIKSDGDGYNVLKIDLKDKSVCVCESNCSISKDCTYSPKIGINGGAIVCVPHNLRIVPLGDGYRSPVTG